MFHFLRSDKRESVNIFYFAEFAEAIVQFHLFLRSVAL